MPASCCDDVPPSCYDDESTSCCDASFVLMILCSQLRAVMLLLMMMLQPLWCDIVVFDVVSALCCY
jgi:hypothetical protein